MTRRCTFLGTALFLVGMFLAPNSVGQIYKMAEMNARQIQALDRQRTVVLVPGGILEEHGPFLLSDTDGYAIEAYTKELAKVFFVKDSSGRVTHCICRETGGGHRVVKKLK